MMPERAVALIAFEVLKVVAACHNIHVLHGDIKVGAAVRHGAWGSAGGARRKSVRRDAYTQGCGRQA